MDLFLTFPYVGSRKGLEIINKKCNAMEIDVKIMNGIPYNIIKKRT